MRIIQRITKYRNEIKEENFLEKTRVVEYSRKEVMHSEKEKEVTKEEFVCN